jgi:hypothetical protein
MDAVSVMAAAAGLDVVLGAPIEVDASTSPTDLQPGELAIGLLPRAVLDPDGEGVAGVATTPADSSGRAVIAIVDELFAETSWERTAGGSVGSITAHEVGHALGLDHDPDPAQLMHATVTDEHPAGPAARDLERLTALANRVCVSQVSGSNRGAPLV